MKRGAQHHPKTLGLQAALGINLAEAVGYLQLLWMHCAEFTPRGDIGRHTDEMLERALDWQGAPGGLVAALVEQRLLDRHPVHRLVVHDWHEHREDGVRRLIERRGCGWAVDDQAAPAPDAPEATPAFAGDLTIVSGHVTDTSVHLPDMSGHVTDMSGHLPDMTRDYAPTSASASASASAIATAIATALPGAGAARAAPLLLRPNPEAEPEPDGQGMLTPAAVIASWNRLAAECVLPPADPLRPPPKLAARCKDPALVSGWPVLLREVRESTFLREKFAGGRGISLAKVLEAPMTRRILAGEFRDTAQPVTAPKATHPGGGASFAERRGPCLDGRVER